MSKGIDESLGKRGTMPVYANGRTTYHTYLIVATNIVLEGKTPNALGVRSIGDGEYKLHFWPNDKVFGGPFEDLRVYTRDRPGRSMGSYTGAVLEREELAAFLGKLSMNPDLVVAPHAKALEQLDKGYDKDNTQYFEVLVGATVPREGLQYGVIPGSELADVFPVGDKTPQSSNADDSDE